MKRYTLYILPDISHSGLLQKSISHILPFIYSLVGLWGKGTKISSIFNPNNFLIKLFADSNNLLQLIQSKWKINCNSYTIKRETENKYLKRHCFTNLQGKITLASVDMDANGKEENSNKSKVNYSMDQNRNPACLHVAKFNHFSTARKLA